jgi:hypothetical protein
MAMDALRVAVAVIIVVAYIATMIAGAFVEGYHYPPGLSAAVWFALGFLLYTPGLRRLKNLKAFSIKIAPPDEDPPDEP